MKTYAIAVTDNGRSCFAGEVRSMAGTKISIESYDGVMLLWAGGCAPSGQAMTFDRSDVELFTSKDDFAIRLGQIMAEQRDSQGKDEAQQC